MNGLIEVAASLWGDDAPSCRRTGHQADEALIQAVQSVVLPRSSVLAAPGYAVGRLDEIMYNSRGWIRHGLTEYRRGMVELTATVLGIGGDDRARDLVEKLVLYRVDRIS